MDSSADHIARECRRFLRWYPRRWLRSNEAAILGMLLDDCERHGAATLSSSVRASIIAGGLRERLLGFERVPRVVSLVLFAGVMFSSFYAFGVTWSPETAVTGGLGPFSNASPLTGALLTAAWLLAVFSAGRSSRIAARVAFVFNAADVALAGWLHWMGPGWEVGLVFAGVALAGSFRVRRRLRA